MTSSKHERQITLFRFLLRLTSFLYVFCLWDSVAQPLIWNVPNRNSYFVGREMILKDVKSSFIEDQNIVVLSGSSGFGKSQIAKEFSHRGYNDYDIVWWFKSNGFLEGQVKNFLLELSIILKLDLETKISHISHEQRVRLIKEILRKNGLRCLIIFDDVAHYELIKSFLPDVFTTNKTHIIVTTKNINLSQRHIIIPPFTKEESRKYIQQFLPNESQSTLDCLSKFSSNCPAAIAMTIEHVKADPSLSLDYYLGLLKKEKNELTILVRKGDEKVGGALEGYEEDLFATVKISLSEIKKNAPEAYKLLCYLSLFHHQQIERKYVEGWSSVVVAQSSVAELINALRSRSFADFSHTSSIGVLNFSMHELIQRIVGELIAPEERAAAIEEAAGVLLSEFSGRSDIVVEKITQDETPLIHALSVVDAANRYDYHSPEILKLRVRVLDVLVCGVRNFDKAIDIESQIQSDLSSGLVLDDYDAAQYHMDMSVYAANLNPNYDVASEHLERASILLGRGEESAEEAIRLIANKLQTHTLSGDLESGRPLLIDGDRLLRTSQSLGYNVLYIFAKAAYLNEVADYAETIRVIESSANMFEAAKLHPLSALWTLYQKAYAQAQVNDLDGAVHSIQKLEEGAREFEESPDKIIFANLNVAKALCSLHDPSLYPNAIELVDKALQIYDAIYKTEIGHKRQAIAHMLRGQLFLQRGDLEAARKDFQLAESIVDFVLPGRTTYLVAELYKNLVCYGADVANDGLIMAYREKLVRSFGIDHPQTKESILYLDRKGIYLPF